MGVMRHPVCVKREMLPTAKYMEYCLCGPQVRCSLHDCELLEVFFPISVYAVV